MTTTPAETIAEETALAITQLIWSVVDNDEVRAGNAASLARTLIKDLVGKLQAIPKGAYLDRSAAIEESHTQHVDQMERAYHRQRSEENLQRLLDAAQAFINEEGT